MRNVRRLEGRTSSLFVNAPVKESTLIPVREKPTPFKGEGIPSEQQQQAALPFCAGLLTYKKPKPLFADFYIKKHNAFLASPALILRELRQRGKKVTEHSISVFLKSFGFHKHEIFALTMFLKKAGKL